MPVILDNPVINGFLQGIQLKRQKEQQEFENQQKLEATGLAKEHLKTWQDQIKSEIAQRQAEMDLASKRFELEGATHQLQARKWVADMISSGQFHPGMGPMPNVQVGGQIQTTQTPGGTGPTYDLNNLPTTQQNVQPTLNVTPGVSRGTINIPGMQPINLDDFANPQELQDLELQHQRRLGQIQADTAGLIAGSRAKAEEPFEIGKENRAAATARQVAQTAHANKLEEIGAEGRNRLQETALRNAGGANEATIRGKFELDANRIKMYGGVDNPSDWNNMVAPYRYGEGSKPLGNTPRDAIIRQHIGDAIPGSVEITPKMAGELKNSVNLNDIYSEMGNIIKQLPVSKVNAAGQHVIGKLPATDARNLDDQVNALTLKALKSNGVFAARAVKTELENFKGLLGGGTGKTKEQALQNLEMGRRVSSSELLDSSLGNAPEAQKLDTLLHYHIDPTQYTQKGTDGKTYPRYQQNPANPKEWGVFNPKTLHYDPVPVGGIQ